MKARTYRKFICACCGRITLVCDLAVCRDPKCDKQICPSCWSKQIKLRPGTTAPEGAFPTDECDIVCSCPPVPPPAWDPSKKKKTVKP